MLPPTVTVHELQTRQLCAVHTINNLLQLTASCENNSSDVSSGYCTKLELDCIANELTLAENALLSVDSSHDKGRNRNELSLSELIFNRHRTILLGNYSVEVLEEALRRRNVNIEWLTLDQLEESAVFEHKCRNNKSLIGWVLNIPVSDENFLKRLVLPKNRRHWLAITKVGIEEDPCWVVLDSRTEQKESIHSTFLLMTYLANHMRNGCTVLKATRGAVQS